MVMVMMVVVVPSTSVATMIPVDLLAHLKYPHSVGINVDQLCHICNKTAIIDHIFIEYYVVKKKWKDLYVLQHINQFKNNQGKYWLRLLRNLQDLLSCLGSPPIHYTFKEIYQVADALVREGSKTNQDNSFLCLKVPP
ncbi:hypothetical protein H5410_004602, partial [Solanum commersonii]